MNGTTTTADDEQRLALLGWLQTTEARTVARKHLERVGLGYYGAEDLLHDVSVAVLRARLPPHIDNPAAYASRAVERRAIDLLRADRVQPRPSGWDDGTEPLTEMADGEATGPDDLVGAGAAEDAMRRALHASLAATRAWTVAAALNTLTLLLHRDVAVPEAVPAPEVGDADQADRWAALWLAGETTVFPTPGAPDTAAIRQSRSRRLREVQRLLARLASVIGGGDRA